MPVTDVAEAVSITFEGQTSAPTPLGGDVTVWDQSSSVTAVAALAEGGFIYVVDSRVIVLSAAGEVVSELYIGLNASIAPRPGGGFIVLTDNGYGRLLDETGAVVQDIYVQGANGQVAGLDDGGWVIVSSTGIRRYEADGDLLSEIVIGGQTFGRDVAMLDDGSYVVVYLNNARRPGFFWFDADGQLITNQNIPPFGIQNATGSANAVAALASGGWVVATFNGSVLSDAGALQFVIYDATGVVVTTNAYVAYSSSDDYDGAGVDVVALPDGGFLLTWTDRYGDGADFGAFAQRFDAAGGAVGTVFQIAVATDGNQNSSSFHGGSTSAVLADGSIVMAFSGEGGTHYRLFDLTQAFEGHAGGSDIPLPITLTPLDPGETIETIRLSGVPEGVLLSAGTLQADGSWILTQAQLTGLTLDPSSGWAGRFTLTVEVTTRDGADTEVTAATQLVRIFAETTLANVAPEAGSFSLSVGAGETLTFDPHSFVSDADADVLTVTHIGLFAIAAGETVSVPGVGNVTLNPDGTLSFAPTADGLGRYYAGERTFSFTVSDGQTSSVQTLTVNVTGTAGWDVLLGGTSGDVLAGLAGDDRLYGDNGNDSLDGGDGADHLEGGNGEDLLAGGAGADDLLGGVGDDTYVVTGPDTVTEYADEGVDLVKASVSYVLPGHVENLLLLFSQALSGTGNALNNAITGNGGANALSGEAGEDTLLGLGGADTLNGGDDRDYLDGGVGNDTLTGGAADDALRGGVGMDRLYGGAGADLLEGGDGADTYVMDDEGDVIVETATGGSDTVEAWINYTLGANLENLTLKGFGWLSGTGNAGKNVITGNDGANWLEGLGGDDTIHGGANLDVLRGGAGNDILYGDAGGDDINGDVGADKIYGGDGTDTLNGFDGADLIEGGAAADTIDGGADNDKLYGGDADDRIAGGTGNDLLDGGAGADEMRGGAGNDTYYVADFSFDFDDSNDDQVIELAGEGTDTVFSSGDYVLPDNVENLTLTGIAETGEGNGLANVISGNGLANRLFGQGGADRLFGMGGSDSLEGGDGADVIDGGDGADILVGGAGADKLTGGAGADLFFFLPSDVRLTSQGLKAEKDQILDLDFGQGDRIDLSGIDNSPGVAMTFVSAFTKSAGQIVLAYAGASNTTTASIDVDGDGKADLIIAITGDLTGTTGNLYTGAGDADGGWYL